MPKASPAFTSFNAGEWAPLLERRQDVAKDANALRRMVNRLRGEPHEQLRERHDAGDFETNTQDKVEAAD